MDERDADTYYQNLGYGKAAVIYEKLILEQPDNTKYIQRLAYCYDKMLDFPRAVKYYGKLVKLDISVPKDYYQYGQLLRITGNIDESKVWIEKYLTLVPDDDIARKQLENMDALMRLKSDLKVVEISNLNGNSRFIDMCPAFYQHGFVYSSARDSFSMVNNNYKWDNQPFLDLYRSDSVANVNLATDKVLYKDLNSRYHEGPVCFSSDFNTIYFTRNSYINGKISRTPEGVNNLRILIADKSGEEWKNIREFPYNSNKYSVGHPALSSDGNTIYFVSDMPGGYGETDIYKSEKNGNQWGKPVNLGPEVNTRGKEMFPYVDKNNILYFSSNGQLGIGGLDIFAASAGADNKYMVVNMGAPLNSQQDDFGFIIQTDSLSGFFSSNRIGGEGADDIYAFKVSKVNLNVIAYDEKTKNTIPEAKVSLLIEDGRVVDTKLADASGNVTFQVKPGLNYQIVGDKKAYLSETKQIKIDRSLFDLTQNEDLYLRRGRPYLNIEVIDKESGLIVPNAIVDISEGKYNPDALEDNNGMLRFELADSSNYTFYATAEEYFDNTVKYSSIGKDIGENTLTIELEKITPGKQFVLEDLHYDLNKSNIRPDAAVVLDKLVKILQDNPDIRIEIGSHTDSRASTEYNEKLSQRRSESVVAYLKSKGIDPGRLIAKGYGESELVNKCADGVDCPEVDHEANRRTVVEILNNNIRKVKRGAKNVYYF
jgi:outer membrane protein OmpA-like peptidoglycan-associated protein